MIDIRYSITVLCEPNVKGVNQYMTLISLIFLWQISTICHWSLLREFRLSRFLNKSKSLGFTYRYLLEGCTTYFQNVQITKVINIVVHFATYENKHQIFFLLVIAKFKWGAQNRKNPSCKQVQLLNNSIQNYAFHSNVPVIEIVKANNL